MAKQCPVCASRYREEIEQRLQAKEPVRVLSAWLQKEKDEVIGKSTLADHAKLHMALASALITQVAPALYEDLLPSVQAIGTYEQCANQLYAHLSQKVLENKPLEPGEALILNASMRERRQNAVARHVLVHGHKVAITGNVKIVKPELKALSLEELKAKRDELRAKAENGGHVH